MLKLSDIILALICGEASALLADDLLKSYSSKTAFLRPLLLLLMPILAVAFIWLSDRFSQRAIIIWQLAKHILVGMLVVFIDLEIFYSLFSLFGSEMGWLSGLSKTISFLFSVCVVKFFGNKYWVFEDKEKNGLAKQFLSFFIMTLIGLMIDVVSFFLLVKSLVPIINLPYLLGVKISVILAAVIAAVWNFLSYKFIVFKK